MKKGIIAVIILFSWSKEYAQLIDEKRANTPVPFTLADRDRLIKLEVKVEEMDKKNEAKFDALQKQIDILQKQLDEQQKQINRVQDEIHWVIGLIIGLFVFILWDRRTYLRPLEKKVMSIEREIEYTKEDRNKLQQLIASLKELSKTDEKVAAVLKQFNLL